ncbi:single-stranded DNA-binding protein [Myroides odoratimimus]|uniref:single-stranded DNA-binding protein n=1 Tax=Myroides odoratimimus TaxID=76832 RepID=UPI0004686EC5|nr:single-stranded DNA-binding protein [Myroides odoratimimus]
MHKLLITGNVGEDAIVTQLPSGTFAINFSLAITEKYKDNVSTVWYKCVRYSNTPKLADYILKGTKLLIEGKPQSEAYINNQDAAVGNLKCVVYNLEFLSSVKDSSTQSAIAEYENQNNDDFPF